MSQGNELDAAIKARMNATGENYSQAWRALNRANPELNAQYERQGAGPSVVVTDNYSRAFAAKVLEFKAAGKSDPEARTLAKADSNVVRHADYDAFGNYIERLTQAGIISPAQAEQKFAVENPEQYARIRQYRKYANAKTTVKIY